MSTRPILTTLIPTNELELELDVVDAKKVSTSHGCGRDFAPGFMAPLPPLYTGLVSHDMLGRPQRHMVLRN